MQWLLPDSEIGVARTGLDTRIVCSNFLPLIGADRLNGELQTLFAEMTKIVDPFSRSLYAAMNLSYLQYFTDGNKRTSRVFQNAVMLASGISPMLFPVSGIKRYLDATLAYYEVGDTRKWKSFMLDAYRQAL